MKISDSIKHKLSWVILIVAVGAMIYFSINTVSPKKKSKPSSRKKITKPIKKNNKKVKNGKIRVLIKEIAFRSSPGVLYGNQIDAIGEGTILTLLGKEGSWYKVKTEGNRVGYISAKKGYTEIIK